LKLCTKLFELIVKIILLFESGYKEVCLNRWYVTLVFLCICFWLASIYQASLMVHISLHSSQGSSFQRQWLLDTCNSSCCQFHPSCIARGRNEFFVSLSFIFCHKNNSNFSGSLVLLQYQLSIALFSSLVIVYLFLCRYRIIFWNLERGIGCGHATYGEVIILFAVFSDLFML